MLYRGVGLSLRGLVAMRLWCLHETGNSARARNVCALSTERLLAVYTSGQNEDVNTSKEVP